MTENIDYEEYHEKNHRSNLSGFELARWNALSHFIPKHVPNEKKLNILDYGAGTGLHLGLWERIFPNSEIFLTDISKTGRTKFLEENSNYLKKYKLIRNNRSEFDSEKFDIIISIEVMEHVSDLFSYLNDILRLLKPGGHFIWTTPCGNLLSVEHIYSLITNQIIKTEEGYRKWAWEDPTHLRRLKSVEIEKKLTLIGFDNVKFRFRAHLFSFICTYCPPKHYFQSMRNIIMNLDYKLFRFFPNGASMIGLANKPK